MKKVLIYTSIGLIIMMLFTANSVVAQSYADYYSDANTVATSPAEILYIYNSSVCSLGTSGENDGHITVYFDEDFQDGMGTDDITIFGYDVDSTSETYEVYCTNWIDEETPLELSEKVGEAYDSDGTVDFDMDGLEGTYNAIHIKTAENSGGGGIWPGAEIDAVYVKNTV